MLPGRTAADPAADRFFNPLQATSRAVFDQAMEKREPRLEKEILNRLGTHQAILFFRNRPTLVQLVYYFPPGAVLAREVPLLPKTPRQPVALTEYVREKQIEAAKARAEKKEEPQPPAAPVRKPGRAKRVPAPKRKDADQAQT